MSEAFLKNFKNVINYQLQEMDSQIQLSLDDISCPDRAELGQNIDLLYMRIIRIALRDTFGSKLSNSILYESGKNFASAYFEIDTVEQLCAYLNQLMIGKIRIVSKDSSMVIFEEDECAVCSGLPEIGETLCSFECGFIAGGLMKITGKDVFVNETKCWGIGDSVCRFEANLMTKGTLDDRNYNVNTVDMIASLASKASIAIELNKELQYKNDIFSKQLELAQNIQKKIIPDSKTFNSEYYQFYSYLQPFRKVGGDFFDMFNVSGERMGVAVADMAGHGIDAAMITSMVKLILRHCSKSQGIMENPSRVMEYVENDINEVIPDTYFSMIYMLLDPVRQSIRYVNAGHPTPILYRKKQNLMQLLKTNMPLVGLNKYMNDQKFIQSSVLYEPGDQLFLYTDGIPETRNSRGEFFHINRMLDIIRKSAGMSIGEVGNNIIHELNVHRNAISQADDICLIGIQL
ncbi:MAG: SpoIIE family protein phosphatase [Eubacteriaceae bacterium]|nr:SpoIIE family protein phosphatase [Eubacteriaceae bacterium]